MKLKNEAVYYKYKQMKIRRFEFMCNSGCISNTLVNVKFIQNFFFKL